MQRDANFQGKPPFQATNEQIMQKQLWASVNKNNSNTIQFSRNLSEWTKTEEFCEQTNVSWEEWNSIYLFSIGNGVVSKNKTERQKRT